MVAAVGIGGVYFLPHGDRISRSKQITHSQIRPRPPSVCNLNRHTTGYSGTAQHAPRCSLYVSAYAFELVGGFRNSKPCFAFNEALRAEGANRFDHEIVSCAVPGVRERRRVHMSLSPIFPSP